MNLLCDNAIDDSLAAPKRILDWFVASTMIKKRYTALYVDKNMLCFNEDSGDAGFFVMEWVFFV